MKIDDNKICQEVYKNCFSLIMNYVIENKLETRQRLPNNLEKAFLGFTMKMLKKSNKNSNNL